MISDDEIENIKDFYFCLMDLDQHLDYERILNLYKKFLDDDILNNVVVYLLAFYINSNKKFTALNSTIKTHILDKIKLKEFDKEFFELNNINLYLDLDSPIDKTLEIKNVRLWLSIVSYLITESQGSKQKLIMRHKLVVLVGLIFFDIPGFYPELLNKNFEYIEVWKKLSLLDDKTLNYLNNFLNRHFLCLPNLINHINYLIGSEFYPLRLINITKKKQANKIEPVLALNISEKFKNYMEMSNKTSNTNPNFYSQNLNAVLKSVKETQKEIQMLFEDKLLEFYYDIQSNESRSIILTKREKSFREDLLKKLVS